MAPTLGYWQLRGLGEPIRYLLYHIGEEFEDKRYDFKITPPFDFGKWGEDKETLGLDFPNLPYYIDGEIGLTQVIAILRYLARKHGLAATDEREQTTLDVVEQQARDLQMGLLNLSYSTIYDQQLPAYVSSLPGKLNRFEKYLKGKDYVLDERLTYVDFMLFEAIKQHLLLVPECLDNLEVLRGYVRKIETLPNVQKYISSDKFKKWPIFAPFAAFGGRGNAPV